MKVAFLGNGDFSLTVLKKLVSSRHEVVCVVGSQDSASGRGQKITFSPVKSFCIDRNIPFLQYRRVSKEGEEDIRSFSPDVLVTASFGQILKQNILDLAHFGVINVHCSLLPKYRGSCPVNFALLNGEKKTGVTIMQTVLALDAGDIESQREMDILPDETAGELLVRLSEMGADMLIETLDRLENGSAVFTSQDESKSSYYPMMSKDMGLIDFNKTSQEIHDFVRGLNPWPLAYTTIGSDRLKVYKACKIDNIWNVDLSQFSTGQVVRSTAKSGLVVKCSDGLVLLDMVQLPGGKVMPSKALLNGRKIAEGTQLGE